MAKEFRTGKDLIKATAESKSGKRRFTKNIYWKAGDIRTVAFVTGADEIPKVRLHQMVRIPDDKMDSGYRYETFLCRKDPSMIDESGGECELCDRVDVDPVERFIALAIELEPIKDGKRVKEVKVKYDTVKRDDGTEVEYPRWGVIIQGAKNFFSYFVAYDEASGDIREVAWEIQRDGEGVGTKYHPFAVMNGKNVVDLPDLTEVIDNIPSLMELLEEMGTPEKYEQVSVLEPGSQPTFGNKRPQNDGANPGSRASEFAKVKEELGSY